MERSSDLVYQLATLHKQQVGTLDPATGEEPRPLALRELDEYFRRSERILQLERELALALEREGRGKAV